MKNTILSVGSVVKAGKAKGLVIGIRLEKESNLLEKEYLLVPYPAGFLGEDSIRLVNVEEVEPVFEGYRPELAESFITYLNTLEKTAAKFGAEKVIEELRKLASADTEIPAESSEESPAPARDGDGESVNSEGLYPLGTVVTIKGRPYEVVIIGYYVHGEDGNIHTYMGINASHGLSLMDDAVLFDAGTIGKAIFNGYEDDEGAAFRGDVLKMVQSNPLLML